MNVASTEKTTNHLYWLGMFFIGSPIMVLVLFALCWGLVGVASLFILPVIIFGVTLGVVVAWIADVCRTRKHNAKVVAQRHQEMLVAMKTR